MRLKVIPTIFICFYSYLGFSQTKKVLFFYEKNIRVSEGNGKCFGNIYREGKEHYSISLFSDSTILITYFRKGAAFPDYKKNETATGRFFKQGDSIYMVRNNITELIPGKSNLSRLDQVFGTLPTRIECSNFNLSFYNSGGIFLTFNGDNVFEKYKNINIISTFSYISVFSPQSSNNAISF